MEALFDGHLRAAVPLSRNEREAAVVWVSALACIALKEDTIDVKFGDYYKSQPGSGQQGTADGTGVPRYPDIDKAVQRALEEKLSRRLDIRLAVTWADRLGLVNAHGDGLRFPHSIMQAYLGSRFMCTALEDEEFYKAAEEALKNPGREFLIALVLYCRAEAIAGEYPAGRELQAGRAAPLPIEAAPAEPSPADRAATASVAPGPASSAPPEPTVSRPAPSASPSPTASAAPGPASSAPPEPTALAAGPEPGTAPAPTGQAARPPAIRGEASSVRDLLKRSAHLATDAVKALDLYAATLEIDSFLDDPAHADIAASVVQRWPAIRAGDQQTLDEAKRGLVRREQSPYGASGLSMTADQARPTVPATSLTPPTGSY
jgi:hypothetical protein